MEFQDVAGFFYMSQQVIPQMKKRNSGHVVEHLKGSLRSTERPQCPHF